MQPTGKSSMRFRKEVRLSRSRESRDETWRHATAAALAETAHRQQHGKTASSNSGPSRLSELYGCSRRNGNMEIFFPLFQDRKTAIGAILEEGVQSMPATLDWSQCAAVESIPGKRSGAWVFKDTRMPVSTVFENLESGASIEEIMEWFDVTREQIVAVLEFAARSLDAPPSAHVPSQMADARSL